METLYIRTPSGPKPIEQRFVEKYNLKPGMRSPFSGWLIVDERGRAEAEEEAPVGLDSASQGELINDEIAEIDNAVTLSQSEIIDFGQGVDSSNG